MIGANLSRSDARIGAWVARGLSAVLLLGAFGAVVFGGSPPIAPPPIPEPSGAPAQPAAAATPQGEWDGQAIAMNLKAWNGPEQGPQTGSETDGGDGAGGTGTEPLVPTPQPMKYLGRLTIGGSDRALVSVGAEQRFVGLDTELDGFTVERIDDDRVLISDGRSRRNIPLERRVSSLGSVAAPANQPIVDPREAAEARAAEIRSERGRTRSGDTTVPSFGRRAMPNDADASDDGSEGS